MEFTSKEETRLLELLGEEQVILEQIRALTGMQAALITADDMEAFNYSLDSRQELIEKINGLHQETDVLMQSYIAFSGQEESAGGAGEMGSGAKTAAGAGKMGSGEMGAGAKSAGVEAALELRRSVLAECAGMNARNLAAANEMAGEYSKRIEKLNLSRKSLGAYALGVSNNSELFDKKT